MLADPGIVRNRLKIASAINNAQAFLEVQAEFGSFRRLHLAIRRRRSDDQCRRPAREVPATDGESDAMSKDLKRRGFKFVGSTICYAFMQATGMVNDHLVGCFRHAQVG